MEYLDLSYTEDARTGPKLRVDFFHSHGNDPDQLTADLTKAGYKIGETGELDVLLGGMLETDGDILLIDCGTIDARQLAGLAALDMKFSRSLSQIIVMTSMDNLDAVFACFDQSDAQFLIEASRTDILLALSRAASAGRGGRVREMSEDDRMRLLRLSEQVDAIAKRLDGNGGDDLDGANSFSEPKVGWIMNSSVTDIHRSPKQAECSLPDPRYVRRIIRQRQARSRFFDSDLFGDPAWDMLLDLTAARGEGKPVSVTSLCIAAGVPATTALRWIKQLVEIGLFERTEDAADKRRAFIGLSKKAETAMAGYFAEFRSEDLAA